MQPIPEFVRPRQHIGPRTFDYSAVVYVVDMSNLPKFAQFNADHDSKMRVNITCELPVLD
jgi:hypothetical protein